MKCPKCGYTSFDYLRECKKCGELLDDSRKALNLKMGEPTLFAGLKDERREAGESEVDKAEEIVNSTTPAAAVSSSSEAGFSPSVSDPLPASPESPTSGEQRTEILSEDISSGLGTLGNMDKLQPRSDEKGALEDAPEIELESYTGAVDELELTPSFNADSDGSDLPTGEENQETEFVLFADEDKPETGSQLKNDIPFEFSASDLERDINLSVPSETTVESEPTDKELIDLELNMEDEESLDQILAELEKKE